MTSYEKMKNTLLKELNRNGLINKDDKILVAFSGGADSVILLKFLYDLQSELEIKVGAMHVNHGIRGKEAERDENFCHDFCKSLDIPFDCVHIDVPSEAKAEGEGTEECARRLRYKALSETAENGNYTKIATAHHADDNLETVLLHMVRGCGLKGLVGIVPERDNIIRPLLSFTKEEIVSALDEIGVNYVYDSTNSDIEMSRNLIRHKVLPYLYKLNPNVSKNVVGMCKTLKEDSDYIERTACKVPENADLNILKTLPEPVLVRYIKIRYSEVFPKGQCPEPERKTLNLIVNSIKNYKKPFKYIMPGKVTAKTDFSGLSFYRENGEEIKDYKLPVFEGENNISPCGYKILMTCDKKVATEWKNIYKLSILMSVNSDKIIKDGKTELYVRNYVRGDNYVFGGHTRVLRRQMINFKIPEHKRKYIPVVTDGYGNIVCVPYIAVGDRYKANKEGNTTYIVFADLNKYN